MPVPFRISYLSYPIDIQRPVLYPFNICFLTCFTSRLPIITLLVDITLVLIIVLSTLHPKAQDWSRYPPLIYT